MKYSELCEIYEELEKNPSRLKKIEILASFLKKMKHENCKIYSKVGIFGARKSEDFRGNKEIIYLLQGRVFPDYNKTELGVSSQLIKKALSKSTGSNESEITKLWKEKGDLGTVAEILVQKKKQRTLTSKELTAEKVLENLRNLTKFTGKGAVEKKISLISELLTSSKSLEARYIIRTILEDLRIGLGSSTIRDSIVEACLETKESLEKRFSGLQKSEKLKKISAESKENSELVQDAYNKSTDFADVFEKACKGKKELEESELTPGKPVKVMLFQKEETIEKGFERVGKPCLIDFKYDGFRMMINKDEKGNIKIFTRRLEDVSLQFPEVKEYAKKYVSGKSFILDSEAVGFSPATKKYLPFQEISQRIKRKYHILKLQKELPVEINVFDILYLNGKSLLKTPYKERRKLLEKIIKNQKYKIRASEAIITSSEKEAQDFYKKAVKAGEEGVMMKNLEAEYKPGSRVGYGIKIKPEENEFDLVITGAEYGTGKRAGWLTSFDVSCKNNGKLLDIGKVSTGLKEKVEMGLSYKEMTKKLKSIITKTEGKHVSVKPELVVTVTYQNIQKSPTYSSGFALRFPRFTRLRPDRSVSDIATIEEVKRDYSKQK